MNYGGAYSDDFLTQGVLPRRCAAWVLDLVLIAILVFVLWWAMAAFGLLTFGLGFGLMAILPFVPFLYHLISLLGPHNATPGQRAFGLIVCRDDDLGPPTGLQAVIAIVVYYLTLAATGLLLVIALFTTRKRTLHDLASGLVVVRLRSLQALTSPPGSWHMNGPSPTPPYGP
ncbi:MAG: RDD family protein [Acetobacteraceae bacterium]